MTSSSGQAISYGVVVNPPNPYGASPSGKLESAMRFSDYSPMLHLKRMDPNPRNSKHFFNEKSGQHNKS